MAPSSRILVATLCGLRIPGERGEWADCTATPVGDTGALEGWLAPFCIILGFQPRHQTCNFYFYFEKKQSLLPVLRYILRFHLVLLKLEQKKITGGDYDKKNPGIESSATGINRAITETYVNCNVFEYVHIYIHKFGREPLSKGLERAKQQAQRQKAQIYALSRHASSAAQPTHLPTFPLPSHQW